MYFFSYIDLLDESQTKLSSDLLDSRQSISQIQVIYIVISEEGHKWIQQNFGKYSYCVQSCFKLSSFFKGTLSSRLQFFFNLLRISLSFVHKTPHEHLLLSSVWIFFLVAIFVRFFLRPFLGTRKVKSVFVMWLLRPYYLTQFFSLLLSQFSCVFARQIFTFVSRNRKFKLHLNGKRQIQVENFSK